jgi:hypothetical protein
MNIRKKDSYLTTKQRKAIISDKVGNYENHPFFVEKFEKANAFLDRVGLPDFVLKKSSTTTKVSKEKSKS